MTDGAGSRSWLAPRLVYLPGTTLTFSSARPEVRQPQRWTRPGRTIAENRKTDAQRGVSRSVLAAAPLVETLP